MITTLLAALFGAAQQAFVVYEGATSSHFVTDHPGSNYSWDVLIDFSPDVNANSGDYSFTTSNGSHEISVQWNTTGLYYLNVTETDIAGCNNRKVMAVNVVSNTRSIAFNSTLSSDCFNPLDNSFEIPLQMLNDGGIPLDEAEFPVNVSFSVNGTVYSQTVDYVNQILAINSAWFTAEIESESQVLIQLSLATNRQGTEIPITEGKDIHTKTIYPVPQLEFIYSKSTVNEQDYGIYEANLSVGNAENASYSWFIEPSEGSSTDLSAVFSSSIEIFWDGPIGQYKVGVSVTDGNGCLSDTIYQLVTVTKSSNDTVVVHAGADTLVAGCQPFEFTVISPLNPDYTYSWHPIDYLNDPNIPNPVFTPGETTTYTLTVTTSDGYTGSDSVTITVSQLEVDAGDDVMMDGENAIVLNGSASLGESVTYSWTTNNGKIDEGASTAYPVISLPGIYYLEVSDAFGCFAIDSVEVSLFANAPIARDDYDTTAFQSAITIDVLANDYDTEENLDPGSLTIINDPVNGMVDINYFENTLTYTPNQNFTGTDVFEYRICDLSQQCDNATVYVLVTPLNFLIPQAFTPNGDNINDFFEILGIEYYPNNSITVINRWGKKVYEAKAYGIDTYPTFWDGKSNIGSNSGDLPTGTYFYVLDLGNGETPIAGSVYIDR